MKNSLHILSIMICFIIFTDASFAQCQINTVAFAPGEVISYNAYYNLGFIWLHAGDVEFKVTSKKYNERDVLHLYAYGTSFKSYDWIFKIRQKYQSYVDPETLMPLWYERDVVEDTYTAFEDYKFDYQNNLIHTYVQKRKRPAVENALPITPCLFDVMTAVYYFRCVDFSKYKEGDKIPIHMILDSQKYDLYIRYLGKDEVKTRNKQKFKCIKFSASVVEGSVFKSGENIIIWVTDDNNRVPVIVEAKIIVGSVKAILNETKGLKY